SKRLRSEGTRGRPAVGAGELFERDRGGSRHSVRLGAGGDGEMRANRRVSDGGGVSLLSDRSSGRLRARDSFFIRRRSLFPLEGRLENEDRGNRCRLWPRADAIADHAENVRSRNGAGGGPVFLTPSDSEEARALKPADHSGSATMRTKRGPPARKASEKQSVTLSSPASSASEAR